MDTASSEAKRDRRDSDGRARSDQDGATSPLLLTTRRIATPPPVLVTAPHSRAQSVTSRRSSRTDKERRRATARMRADEELARIDKELIKKRLAFELDQIDSSSEEDVRSIRSKYDRDIGRVFRSASAVFEREQISRVPNAPHSDVGVRVTDYNSGARRDISPRAQRMTNVFAGSSNRVTPAFELASRPEPVDEFHPISGDLNALGVGGGDHVRPAAELHDAAQETSGLTDIDRLAIALTKSNIKKVRDLPEYCGNSLDWLAFKNAYDETSRTWLFSKAENMNRLRIALKGEAKEAVSALLCTCAGPDEVMAALARRFGHPVKIARDQIAVLKNLPKQRDNQPNELSIFASKVHNSIVALRALNHVGYLHNPELLMSILEKLTSVQRAKWVDYAAELPDDKAEVEVLSMFLNREVDRSMKYVPLETSKQTLQIQQSSWQNKAKINHAMNKKTICVCCGKDHNLTSCPDFKSRDNDTRWKFVTQNKLCFRCLSNKHRRRSCGAKLCGVGDCRKPHHALLHSTRDSRDEHSSAVVSKVDCFELKALLKILPVVVTGPTGQETIFALLDDGSSITLIDEDLADRIGASGPKQTLHLSGINNDSQITSQSIELNLRGCEPFKNNFVLRARTVKNFKLCPQSITNNFTHYQYLNGLPILEYQNAEPTLLIGQDNVGLLLPSEIRKGDTNEPVAALTPLGWVLHGNVNSLRYNHVVLHLSQYDTELHDLVNRSFSIDSIGVTRMERTNASDQHAIDIINETATKINGRWVVGLPWITKDVVLPDNRESALTRLFGIEKRMQKDAKFAESYKKQVSDLLDKQYAELCRTQGQHGRTWFLPHFAVTNPNKPGKFRMVFDAAARSSGVCLNDKLLTGPDLLQSLLGVLLRFRQGEVAVIADIREMFLRVQIREEDRDAQRFLWRDDTGRDVMEYRMSSMIFGAASSPFTALLIKNKNAEYVRESQPRVFKAIVNNHYMDDYVDSFLTEHEARQVAISVTAVHANGGFELRSFASNSSYVLEAFLPEQRALGVIHLTDGSDYQEKTLGLMWNPINDTIGFNMRMPRVPTQIVSGVDTPTKRQVLRTVMSVFDPLGLVNPVTISGRILLQDIWRSGIDWDTKLSNEHACRWGEWLKCLLFLRDLHIPRCYGVMSQVVEIHTFCDASESAYAAACYWRTTSTPMTIRLITSKARVTPLRPISIPRLELQAAVLGARLANTVIREHDLKPVRRVFWTDSSTTLAWIRSDPRSYKTFVANRLGEIDELSDVAEWRWVPTKQNPADLATRERVAQLSLENEWFIGPPFLLLEEQFWPKCPLAKVLDDKVERKSETVLVISLKPFVLPDPSRFSSWSKLINATAYMLLFIRNCRTRPRQNQSIEIRRTSESLWIQQVQRQCYAKELECLNQGTPIPTDSNLLQVSPYLDETGLMRVRGRIDAATEVCFDTKRPVILGKHIYTNLLLSHFHQRYHHGSTETVLNEIRQQFWIPCLRAKLRLITHCCQWCRVHKARPAVPPVGDLPIERLGHHKRPFTHCGLDYFGPMEVSIGRRRELRYVALFTCLTTRAIHLEVAASLTTDSVILAIRRMMARRGCPSSIHSDNGTNFRGADRELRNAWREINQDIVGGELSNYGISWHFNPPAAPHMGGSWERLVQAVKKTLRVTLKERAPREEVLLTVIAEAELTVNSRPLTYVSTDPADKEALTPNHFLLGSSSGVLSPGVFGDYDLYRRKNWRVAQRLADMFWARWVTEYMPLLIIREKNSNSYKNLKLGDIVLIADNKLPRNTWPKGVIVGTNPGTDGTVRVVDVKTQYGTFRRPAVKIVVLPTNGQ